MNKLPVSENEEQRLNALRDYQILDSLSEDEFDRITELASIICDVPISLVSLVDENRQWFKSRLGLSVSETPRNLAFCQYTIMGTTLFEIEDTANDDRFKDNTLVTADPNIRFYAGYPLIDPKGYALGTLCVIDRVPKVLTDKQKRSLELLAREVIGLIVERRQKTVLKNFEKLFQLSDDLICVAGTDGFFKEVNPAFEKLLGWDQSVLLKASFFGLIHPDDLENTQNEIQKLASGQHTINFTHRFKTKTNQYKLLQWVATPEPSTGNLFAIARDISEEMEKEHQLAASEKRLRSFFENSQGLMCTHDLQGNFLSVNNAGASILGYTTEQLKKLSLFDIIPQSRHAFLNEYLSEVIAKGYAKGQMVTRHRDGSFRIWMFNNILERDSEDTAYVIGNAIDITEKHHLEVDLEHTKAILEQTNQVARVGGWEFDVQQQKIYWTSVTKEIHGVDERFEPDLTTAISFYKEGKSRDSISRALSTAINEGKSWDLELQIINAKGKEMWVRALGNADFENGVCKRVYGTFQDIDEKKNAELEVRRSRKLLDNVLDSASEVSIIATDTDGLITVFNKGAERLLGYSAEEMIGRQSSAIIHSQEEVLLRGKELTLEFGHPISGFQVFIQKPQIDGSEQREWTYIKKDGSKCEVSLVITAIRDPENQINGYLGIAIDITERKSIENALITEKARLSAFVEHAPAAVAMTDNSMNYIAVSNRWLEDYQLTGRNIIGTSHYDVFTHIQQEDMDRHRRVLNGAIERKEEDLIKPEGIEHEMYISWEMRPWYRFDEMIGGMMIFTQDVTQTVIQREGLKTAKLQAEQASIAKSEFLANMSHEIRTPLNGVIGFTDLVLKTKLSETQQQYLSIVNQSANALLSIINDILDFSKIEAGKLELDIEKCDLYEIGCQATDIITYQVQTRGLEMLLNISPELPRFIWADDVRLKQILINLLGNAVKFTEKGEIELKIHALLSEGEETIIRFGVRDTGIGIKPDKQEKIFEAFSQEDGSTTKKYGGTGLGLTISNKLLGLMDSKLQIKSTPGAGSFFYFDLKLKTEQGDPIDWENIDLIKKVLVVDDNDNNRMILTQMLLLKQIQTIEAKNGFEALQLLAKGEHFDVILMDYHMPYMDGLETIRKIRESFYSSHEEQPIVLLYSSSDDEKVIKACEELNVNHRLIKPVKMQDIYNTLSRLHKKGKDVREELNATAVQTTTNPVTILVAEDNTVNMLLARTIIKRIAPNAVLLEAKNGIEALDHFISQRPDLILMDIQMPEMNGYEATQKIRALEENGHVPIIALTAGNVKSEKEKCLEAGMDDFVVKPVIEETIALLLNKWLHTNQPPSASDRSEIVSDADHFDMNRIRNLIGDEPEIISEIIALTKVELTESKIELEKCVLMENLTALNNTGHKLYGTALSAGLPILARLANEIEQLDSFGEETVSSLLYKTYAEIDSIIQLMV